MHLQSKNRLRKQQQRKQKPRIRQHSLKNVLYRKRKVKRTSVLGKTIDFEERGKEGEKGNPSVLRHLLSRPGRGSFRSCKID